LANLTITIDAEVLKQARIRALEQGTSVNAVLREFLNAYTDVDDAGRRSIQALLSRSQNARSRSGGRTWTRDELHER
jgi:hypothetical protein